MAPRIAEKDTFKVVRARKGAGLGLVALVPFKKEDFVIEYTGNLIPTEEADEKGGKYLFDINSKWTIDGSPRENLARYINHSCKPNCEAEISGKRVKIYAIKNIKAGEELTYDYGEEYFDEFIKPHGCKCNHCVSKKTKAKKR
ncbi:MAG: SET domain-containing protein [Candidatus Pacebacteria bacterium]|nr:SET domain-containing protein [Candidatus Paceibacterota bacterium]